MRSLEDTFIEDHDLAEVDLSSLEAALEKIVCGASFYEFVRAAWHVVVRNHAFVDSWHVKVLCDHLQAVTEGKIERLLINIPPRHTKSLLVSVFWPAWVWTRNPAFQWLFASRTTRVSLRDNWKCRILLESRWYQDRWPLQLADDQNAKSHYANAEGGHRMATSAGSQAIGLDADAMVIDDLHGINDAEALIAKHVEWVEETLWTRGNTEHAPRVVIGQRVRAGDISGRIISGKAGGGWVCVILPMEFEPARRCETGLETEDYPQGFVDPRLPGEILCPNRFGAKTVAEFKANANRFARLFQQNPTPTEGGIIKRIWLNSTWEEIDCSKVRKWGTSCDTPFRKGKNTDYFVIQLIAIVGTQYLIVDQVRARMSFTEMKAAYAGFINRWISLGVPITKNLLEASASGHAIEDSLKKAVRNIVPYHPGRDSKEQRFETASDTFRAGNVKTPAAGARIFKDGKVIHIHHDVPQWVGGWKEEVGTVPYADHDDQADTTCQYILDDQMHAGVTAASAIAEPAVDPNAHYERPGKWRGGTG